MFAAWFVDTLEEDIWLAPRLGGDPVPDGAMRMAPSAAALRAAAWFPEGSQSTLLEMVQCLERNLSGVTSAPMSWLVDRVAEALREGRLEAYVVPRIRTFSAQETPEVKPASAPPPGPKDERTWVAIQLLDEDGKPVPAKRYKIVHPGGTREGTLDGNGLARVDGIDPGTCEVSFPTLDASDWKAA